MAEFQGRVALAAIAISWAVVSSLAAQESRKPESAPALADSLAALAAHYPLKGKTRDPAADLIATSWGEKPSATYTKPRAGGWSAAEESFVEYRNPHVLAIARMGRDGRNASKPLMEIVAGGHVALRPDALRALALVDPGNPDVAKLGTTRLGDSNPFVRLAAADAVRFLGPRAAGARKELVKRLPDARPYELRALFRAIEAVGFDGPASVDELVAAVKKKTPDAASIAAAHRLGVDQVPDAAVLAALQEGLKSERPALVCASAYSLGRLVPSPAPAAKDLLAVLRRIEFEEEMDLWQATKGAFAIEALGRLGPASTDALTRMTRNAREIADQEWGVLRLSGLGGHDLARAFWMIRPPPDAAFGPVAIDAATKSDPPWWGDGDDDGQPGVVRWLHRLSPTHVVLEYGAAPENWADWSTVQELPGNSVLLSLRREEEGVDIRLLDIDRAKRWALQKEADLRAADLYKIEARMKPADLDKAEKLELDFRTVIIKDSGRARWRGGFAIPNPFRQAPK